MRETIRFILNGELHQVSGVDPTLTVLNYLRYGLGKTGTKEGCAEGDCGACTIVVGTLVEGVVHYRAVNACIMFLPVLDGKEVITVEGLAGPDGTLHPVQQALVDHHGSQCGFCTPGFVMALYAHYRNQGGTSVPEINDAVAGNLCRCTGYGPIISAAQAMYDYPTPGRDADDRAARLKELQQEAPLDLTYHCARANAEKRFIAPKTLDQLAAASLKYPEATYLAGGTDVGLWVTKQQRFLETTILTTQVDDLRAITEHDDTIEIGAAVSYTDVFDLLGTYYPSFGELLRRLGSTQIRNSGTMGGNIANGSPIGDSMPALIAVGTDLVLRRGEDTRKIPLEDYFLDYQQQDRRPGEFVERFFVRKPQENTIFYTHKISKRFDQDISAVCGAFGFTVEDGRIAEARICFGGVAAIPKRAAKTEVALTGQPWTLASVRSAAPMLASDFAPISDMRASADYRIATARNLLVKAFLDTSGQPFQTDVLVADEALHA